MNYKQAIKDLLSYSKMNSEKDIKLFDEYVYELADTKNPQILERLLEIFDDNCDFPEVMYSLVHAVESYPMEVYIKKLVASIPKGIQKHPFWLETLVSRVFNNKEYASLFQKNIFLADVVSLKKLFRIIEQESPHHYNLIKKLEGYISLPRIV